MREVKGAVTSICFAAMLLAAATASAQPRARVLGDVSFGASPDAVRAAMKALTLEPVAEPAPDDPLLLDHRFKGQLKGQPVLVSASFDPAGSLEKMLVSFLTADEDCVAFYRTLKTELQQKYGAPVTEIERWDFPYQKGGHVGQEHVAIRVGKGQLATVWNDADAGSTEGGVVITTADDVIVQLAYESSRWAAEAARRRKLLEEAPEPASGTTSRTSLMRGE